MKKAIGELLSSKKGTALIVGLVTTVAVHVGLDASIADKVVPEIVKLIMAFIVGTGMADLGKAKAQIEATA